MRQTVTLFRFRYEGSNPSHLKKRREEKKNERNQSSKSERKKKKERKTSRRKRSEEREPKEVTKKSRKGKSPTICERGTEKSRENRGESLAKGVWDWTSEGKRSLSGMWKKTIGKSGEFGRRTCAFDGRMENGKSSLFIG